ncbi:hypothetical protein F5Y16DRAFT_51500 [Xylariaceae sp. FL0255]|nr:hypothetical protein F5Y16DRAFT_51500 [Xylariaceae sp. FL0255]
MALPYQCLSPLGKATLICVSRGASLHTIDLSTQPPIVVHSWAHSSSKSVVDTNTKAEGKEGRPPSKRRKVVSEIASDAEGGQEAAVEPTGKKGSKKERKQGPAKTEEPLIVLLKATTDGCHVVAVTGLDKSLWVFEHDGRGSLKELSRRVMPKRPNSLAFTADEKTILSGDKFGDVYALPLLVSPSETTAEDQKSTSSAPPTAPSNGSTPASSNTQAKSSVRGANEFTVHSGRNLRALEDQRLQRERNMKLDQPKEGPSFAHELLLGHVSLLTCVVTAKDGQGRPYIITSDRDEHIRISRGMPQAHVIENYCLVHGSFVSALCLPRPDILVSGGGDSELFAWDWLAGRLLGTTDLLAHVKEIEPDVLRLAVTKLLAFEAGGGTYVAVICERVPALFIFHITHGDSTLSHSQTLRLPGNPLDIIMLDTAGTAPRLLTSVDSESSSLLVLEQRESIWTIHSSISSPFNAEKFMSMSREDLDKILYTTENLRKSDMDNAANGED